MLKFRVPMLTLALLAGFSFVAADLAEARVGGGGSIGSRGSRTYTAPPATNTAPKAAPVERSMTDKSSAAAAKAAQPAAAARPSMFGGFRGLLMGGLFAAALAGIFGVGALASMLGFLLQAALIGGVIYFVVNYFRSRNQPAVASAGAGAGSGNARPILNREAMATGGSSAAPGLQIVKGDFDTFERLLGEIQTAYGREDVNKLGAVTTPEMLSYFSHELSDRAKQGLINEVSGVKLLQGDLSEAWRENGTDYATVAMRYSLIDATVERASGRVVSGDRKNPTEATEFWTFCRDGRSSGNGWVLSAIQQTA